MNLSVVELSVLLFCAISLGVVIHFFFVSKKNLKQSPVEVGKFKKLLEEWKLKYFNDIEVKDRELLELRNKLSKVEEDTTIFQMEIEELRKERKIYREAPAVNNTDG